MGGWGPKTPRDILLRDTNKWIEQAAGPDKGLILAPYTPKTYCSIAKLRATPENVAAISFRFQELLKEQERTQPPTWAATERSPQEGARKRSIKDAVEKVSAEHPMLDVDSNGTIFSGGFEAARWLHTTSTWLKRDAWRSTGVNWERLMESMAR